MSAIGLSLSLWLMASSLLELANRIQLFKKPSGALKRLKAVTRAQWGMTLAHMGLGVVILGVATAETFTQEKLTTVRLGESVEVGNFSFTFEKVEPLAGPNYSAVRGYFRVSEDGEKITTLTPEDRVYNDPQTQTTEAAIYPLVRGDLYAVIGDPLADGRWSVRLYFKPFVSALWLGSIMMMLGGLVSIMDRRLRLGLPLGRQSAAKGA